jgi:hypothetical protein
MPMGEIGPADCVGRQMVAWGLACLLMNVICIMFFFKFLHVIGFSYFTALAHTFRIPEIKRLIKKSIKKVMFWEHI